MTRETTLFNELLKNNGYSLTSPRARLFEILQNHNACTMAELTALLGDYDRATVYRTVELFEKLSIINRLHLGWKFKLELSDIFHHHHHHLSCTNCGKVTVLEENSLIEDQIAQLGQKNGFKAMDHQLEIRGLCQNCI